MEKKHKILLAAGAVLCVLLFFIDIYLGATAVIILAALAMCVFIMEDSRVLPEVTIRLDDEAKKVVVENTGNAMANKVHVALVPLDIEFDLPGLEADAKYEYPLSRMITEAKAIVSFDNAKGGRTSRTFTLSAMGKGDDDLLKPMFPMFKWK
ncbi:MAG TPA: hypothetical protein PKM50_05400 [Methanoregula sp.]|nr:hypothetical protein [Methanoregula sp.]